MIKELICMTNILAFFAHPDDEVNCAGLMHKNFNEGGNNLVICFTSNKKRLEELKESCAIIGAELLVLDFKGLDIKYSKSLRTKLKKIIVRYKPDIAIIQANDYHPDHRSVHQIAFDTLTFVSHGDEKYSWFTPIILEAEATGLITYPDVIVNIDAEQEVRRKAFSAHQSQVQSKSFGDAYIRTLEEKAKLRGAQIGCVYGEAYKRHLIPIKGDFYYKNRGIQSVVDLVCLK